MYVGNNRYILPGSHRQCHTHSAGTCLPDGMVFCSNNQSIDVPCIQTWNITQQKYVYYNKGMNINIRIHNVMQSCTIRAHKITCERSNPVYSDNMLGKRNEVEETVCTCFQVLRELRDPVSVPQGPVRKGWSIWPKWPQKATPWMRHLPEHGSRKPSTVRTSR